MTGQYIGILTLTAISIFGAAGLFILLEDKTRFLGLLPLIAAIRSMAGKKQEKGKPEEKESVSCLSAAGLTIANGGDNIGVYIPVFTQYGAWETVATLFTFLVFTGLLCLTGYKAARLPFLHNTLLKYKRAAVPAVLAAIGLWILLN